MLPVDQASRVVSEFHAVTRAVNAAHGMVEHAGAVLLSESMESIMSALPIAKTLSASPLQPWHWIQLASAVG